MRLQRHINREVNHKKYYRSSIDLPPKMIKALGWKKGSDLSAMAKHGRLIVKKKR